MKALLASGEVPFELDMDRLYEYLHYEYVWEPESAIRGVKKLPAGHRMVVNLQNGQSQVEAYWNLSDSPPCSDDPIDRLDAELQESCRLTARADVPLGIALSGGLDSSLIAALTAHHATQPVHAITIGYDGVPHCDEREQALQLATSLNIEHHTVELAPDQVALNFPDLIHSLDEPLSDISASGYFALAQRSRALGIPVLLYGLGADELCWGYRYCQEALRQLIRKRTSFVQDAIPWQEYLLPSPIDPMALTNSGACTQIKRSLRGLREAFRDQSHPDHLILPELLPTFLHMKRRAQAVFHPDWLEHRLESQLTDHLHHCGWADDPSTALITLLQRSYLQSNGLNQNDRIGMFHSIESRMPLVDANLSSLLIGLQKSHPLPAGKSWFRSIAKRYLPAALLDLPKQGFTPPVYDWNQAIFAAHGHFLEDGKLCQLGILRPEVARRYARSAFRFSQEELLPYRLLVLELWIRSMESIVMEATQQSFPSSPNEASNHGHPEEPTITLFTVPKAFTGETAKRQHNAISSWKAMVPQAEIFLIGDEPGIAEACQQHGVRHLPQLAHNGSGTPFVSDAFRQAELHACAETLCYFNADILLCTPLTRPLQVLSQQWAHFLAVGRRWNLTIDQSLQEIPDWATLLPKQAREENALDRLNAIDYFVFPKGSLGPLRPFLIGRPAWDNYTLYQARRRQLPLVDLTEAVTIIHQKHDYGHIPGGSGATWDGFENQENWNLLGEFTQAFDIRHCTWALQEGGHLAPAKLLPWWRRIGYLLRLHPRAYGVITALHDFLQRSMEVGKRALKTDQR
jgi:asparagine synthase (glutamine-hydrolysing)